VEHKKMYLLSGGFVEIKEEQFHYQNNRCLELFPIEIKFGG
jgi:hypothetical protein